MFAKSVDSVKTLIEACKSVNPAFAATEKLPDPSPLRRARLGGSFPAADRRGRVLTGTHAPRCSPNDAYPNDPDSP